MAKQLGNFAFIDSANMHLGVRDQGWSIDYSRLRRYLRDKYNVERAFLFLGYRDDQKKMYAHLKRARFGLVFRQTVPYREGGQKVYKGNVDAELILHAAAIKYENYDKAVIISSDGDFACLIDFLKTRNKLSRIITPSNQYSSLLSEYSDYITPISKIRKQIEFRKQSKK